VFVDLIAGVLFNLVLNFQADMQYFQIATSMCRQITSLVVWMASLRIRSVM
jgi:hypothetical protein